MKKIYGLLLLGCFVVFSAHAALAAKTVSSSGVTKGEFSIENQGQFEFDDDDDDAYDHSLEFEYGFTDRFKVEVGGEVNKVEGDSAEFHTIDAKAKFKLTDENYFLRSALQLDYDWDMQGGADQIGTEIQMQKKYGQWDQRFNVGFDHETGEDSESGVSMDIEAGSYYELTDYKVGLEYFADFGRLEDDLSYSDQKHLLGPSISFDLPIPNQDVGVQLGYLAGISDAAADHNLKYVVEVSF